MEDQLSNVLAELSLHQDSSSFTLLQQIQSLQEANETFSIQPLSDQSEKYQLIFIFYSIKLLEFIIDLQTNTITK